MNDEREDLAEALCEADDYIYGLLTPDEADHYRKFAGAILAAGYRKVTEQDAEPVMDRAETPIEEYCAEYDKDGNIRLSCGRGLLIALFRDSREDVQSWIEMSKPGKHRERYQAALSLIDGRRCQHRAKEKTA